MKITDSAQEALLNVMKAKAMDPKVWCFEVKILENGGVGIGFTKELIGPTVKFGELTVAVDANVDTTGIVVDFVETDDGKKGIVFMGDK